MFECFNGESDGVRNIAFSLGCLSEPVQDRLSSLKTEMKL